MLVKRDVANWGRVIILLMTMRLYLFAYQVSVIIVGLRVWSFACSTRGAMSFAIGLTG